MRPRHYRKFIEERMSDSDIARRLNQLRVPAHFKDRIWTHYTGFAWPILVGHSPGERHFGVRSLRDRRGKTMRWVGRLKPPLYSPVDDNSRINICHRLPALTCGFRQPRDREAIQIVSMQPRM